MTAPTLALLAGLVLYALGVEAVTRRVLAPASKVQRTLDAEIAAAERLRPAAAGQPKTVLLVGNSLLEAGVDVGALNRSLQPGWRARRVVVTDTVYTDWHFGLQRLLDSGARPDAMVILFSPVQLMRTSVRGSYFAHYLMRTRDLPEVVRLTHMHPTEASSLLVARYSLFYGMRTQLRNVILGRLFPDLPTLIRAPFAGISSVPDTPEARQTAEVRLRDLRDIARARGIRLAVVVPPLLGDDASKGTLLMMDSGARAGVSVLKPMAAGELPPAAFSDGLHANAQGAEAYTRRLGGTLLSWLDQP